MILINFKLIIHEWKKISFIAFLATIFLFFAGGINSNDIVENILVFICIFIGLFIGVNIFWTAGSSISKFTAALKFKRGLENKNQSENLPPDKN